MGQRSWVFPGAAPDCVRLMRHQLPEAASTNYHHSEASCPDMPALPYATMISRPFSTRYSQRLCRGPSLTYGAVGATAASEQSDAAQAGGELESVSAPVVAATSTSTSTTRGTAKVEEAVKGAAETKETRSQLIRELSKGKSKAGSRSKAEGKAKAVATEEEKRVVSTEEEVGVGGTTKLRRCTFCGKQGHNRRTCPDLREKSS